MTIERPPEISAEDWERTPPAVQALIAQFRAQLQEDQAKSGPQTVPQLATSETRPEWQLLIESFVRLRRSGFNLGLGELLAALQAVEGGWGRDDWLALKRMAQLLWCNSVEERREFDYIWDKVVETAGSETPEAQPEWSPPSPAFTAEPLPSPPAIEPTHEAQKAAAEWKTLPIQAPYTPAMLEDSAELNSYWPLSRRFMVYTWRYLRRPLPDGPADLLDVEGTVAKTARLGFFLAPVYRRRERNHAHLILLIDQGGSMTPFHRFTRDIVETAQQKSSIEEINVFYFHDVPGAALYLDPHLTKPIEFEPALAQCSNDTSVLVVSDAGSARGYRHLPRVRATTRFLSRLKRQTPLLAWLNPMPVERWVGTSAQMIAVLAPMFQMDPDGFSNAIDVVRGQPMHHYR